MDLLFCKMRINELSNAIDSINTQLKKFPEGNLRIENVHGRCRYFIVTKKGDTKGRYIREKEKNLAYTLAEKSYCEKLLNECIRERNAIDAFLNSMYGTAPEEVYDNLNEPRRALVTPLLLSDRDYAERWSREEFEENPYNPEEKVYDTKRGDKVRSKSEAFIADIYFDLGIPYRYECALKLSDGKVKYPDFTLLKLPERKLIYHEHMGMMEDEEYRRANIVKLNEYARSGINSCDNLILSFETDYAPLNTRHIRTTIERVFLKQ